MRVLDLYCGGGGASAGYVRAGHEVVGVDLHPQPNYPWRFLRGDVLALSPEAIASHFDAVHASPPCQSHSPLAAFNLARGLDVGPDLVAETRALLQATGLPYVIENVVQAPLLGPTVLCGQTFGLKLYRHRAFETSWSLPPAPKHLPHVARCQRGGYLPTEAFPYMTITGRNGHNSRAWTAAAARCLDVPWLAADLNATCEAIPPAYTEWIGRHLP